MCGAAGPRWACCRDTSSEDDDGGGGDVGVDAESQWHRRGCMYSSCFCCCADCSFQWIEPPDV